MLRVVAGCRSDVGRVRKVNEDNMFAGRRLWAVADGMGGHAAGDVAAALVVAELARFDEGSEWRTDQLGEAVSRANEQVLQYGRQHPDAAGLGATLAGIALVQLGGADHWAVFNIGDARVYRCWEGQLARATTDHSEIEELLLAGRITQAEARVHAARHIVTRSLGSDPAPTLDLWTLPVTPGERFVVCSDGLTGEVEDSAIAVILSREPNSGAAAELLLQSALDGGGRDNVTVIVLDVEDSDLSEQDDLTNPQEIENPREAHV